MVDDAHCDQPMLHGFQTYRSPRGKCEIRGAGPNLWFAVAPALGFQVGSFRFSHSDFAQLMESYCPQAATLDAHTRRCNSLPEIIFLDPISLPCGADSENYWAYWRTPHVFFYQDGDLDLAGYTGKKRPCAPRNWEERAIHLSHREAGGGTSSLWVIAVAWLHMNVTVRAWEWKVSHFVAVSDISGLFRCSSNANGDWCDAMYIHEF